jgi:hypothetical protein
MRSLPISEHYGRALLFRYAKDQLMDECPSPGNLILNRHDQQRSGKTVHAREAHWEVSRFYKSDIEQEVADS